MLRHTRRTAGLACGQKRYACLRSLPLVLVGTRSPHRHSVPASVARPSRLPQNTDGRDDRRGPESCPRGKASRRITFESSRTNLQTPLPPGTMLVVKKIRRTRAEQGATLLKLSPCVVYSLPIYRGCAQETATTEGRSGEDNVLVDPNGHGATTGYLGGQGRQYPSPQTNSCTAQVRLVPATSQRPQAVAIVQATGRRNTFE